MKELSDRLSSGLLSSGLHGGCRMKDLTSLRVLPVVVLVLISVERSGQSHPLSEYKLNLWFSLSSTAG